MIMTVSKRNHTCITGRDSLAWSSTPQEANPVPPCKKTVHSIANGWNIILCCRHGTILFYADNNSWYHCHVQTAELGSTLTYFDDFYFNCTLDNTHTLCKKMMSLSESLSPVTGSIISFLINFSTHSCVTTAPLNTRQC